MQKNIIGEYLKPNNKVQWSYSNKFISSKSIKYPLDTAEGIIKKGIFEFDIYYKKEITNSYGRIMIKLFDHNNKRCAIDMIDLSSIEDISNEIIFDSIDNWIKDFKQKVLSCN